MQLDEPFPLEAIAPRVRRVILDEFQGHWPTVHEIAQISDRHWLATPGVGPGTLEAMRRITHPPRQQDDPGSPRLSDAALLDRLGASGRGSGGSRALTIRMRGTARTDDHCQSPDWVGSGPKAWPLVPPGRAASRERFVLTHTGQGLWSVAHDGETFATCPTEKEALSITFTRAAERRQAGFEVVVVVTQARNEQGGNVKARSNNPG
jgi:hypothetical protein